MRVLVLPVKSLEETKSRLAPVLSPLERAALTLAMLEDVMDATLALPGWETWVVSPDEAVLEVALSRRARVIREAESSLSSAIRQVEEEVVARSADSLAVLLADTPLVTARSLTRALHTLGPIVLAPSLDEGGTNLLVRRPPTAIPARFGRDSYRQHLEEAATADLPTAVVEDHELGFDLDVPGDILTVLDARRRGRTRQVCLDVDVRARLPGPEEGRVPQGTIKDFDEGARTGSLLTDDSREVAIDATSLEGAGIRTLRIGQRVKFRLAEEGGRGVARSLRIVTFD